METIDKIKAVKTAPGDRPIETVTITDAKVLDPKAEKKKQTTKK
jgi:hypothetical protein